MLNKVAHIRRDEELDMLAILTEKTPNNQIGMSTQADTNLILIVGRGIWTKAVLASHFSQLDHALQSKRRRFPTTRILCDVSERGEQSPEILEAIRTGSGQLYSATDRLVLVTSSSLMKMQLRQQFEHDNIAYFVSVETAKTWLDAYQ
ncbi:MAG TPA: hypothetical protein VF509_15575 [Sphingobium sp.]